jgi:signal transduction histidine kinase
MQVDVAESRHPALSRTTGAGSVSPLSRLTRFRRLRSKLTASYLALFLTVLWVILTAVYVSVAGNAERVVRDELNASAVVFDRIWALRMAQMQSGAELLADDFGFKAAVATHDAPTIGSALSNLRRRLGFDAALVVSPDGAVVAADGLTVSRADLASLRDLGQNDGEGGVFVASNMPYQAVSAPIMAPTLVGDVVFANKLDAREMASLARLSPIGLRPQVVIQNPDGALRSGADGLSAAERSHLAAELSKGGAAEPHAIRIGPYMEVARPLASLGPQRAALLLRYTMAAALAPYQGLLALVLGFGAIGLLLVTFGSWALARQVTRPIAALTGAAEKLERGEGGSVEVEGADEIAALGLTFNRMADRILKREEALAAARINAESANRAKSDFLANMSHEIRTPLNGILGMTQVLVRGELAPRQRERLEVIRNSGEDLLAILNSILDLSKIEAGQMEIETQPFDLAEAVRATSEPFATLAAEKGLGFHVDLDPAAAGLWSGDALRLRQVLSNLASNAVKFTEVGRVTLGVTRTRAGVRFEVADTGLGIPRERHAEVFAKFSQIDASSTRKFGGAGLGLAICRELVGLMGGELTLDSEPGRGSVFAFELPLPPAPQAAPAPEPEADAAEADERPPRILAAEDNPTNRTILTALLGFTEAQVTMVEDGRQAVEAFQSADYDVVLMDIQMPRMNGIDAAQAIRAFEVERRRARTPILAVSANVMSHQVAEYAAAGMDGVVAKPLKAETLFAEIARVLAAAPAVQAA